ncbi:MAG: GNAT family N-acetyltransferase [Actinomycetota bacterium]
MDLPIRAYDPERDLDHVLRTWLEVGWLDSPDKKDALQAFFEPANVEVGLIDDEAECSVHWVPGEIQYEQSRLGLCAVTAVTTSHIGRRQGLASRLTARALQQGAEAGHAVSALGMFEQGFYDRVGFGTGAYDNQLQFDPANLLVDHIPYRRPVRVTMDEWADIHAAMRYRLGSHGAVYLDPPRLVEGEVGFADNPFALGYRDEDGVLTHMVYGDLKGEHGPFAINAIAYQSTDQLLELLRLLRELGDQFRSVKMIEPAHVQLQALLREPLRERQRSINSEMESFNRSMAWWQLRVLDVPACVAARSWTGEPVRFNLTLTDPLSGRLADGWPGVAGDYTITIADESSAESGHADGLPTLTTGVAAFTRLWFGVASATTLAVTDPIDAPAHLLSALDDALLLPRPLPGWQF